MAVEQNAMGVQAAVNQASSAIFTLLRDSNPENRAQANTWLASLSAQPEAWPITVALSLQIYDAAHQDLQFFALNMLLHKVRSDNRHQQVSEDEKAVVYYKLLEALPKAGSDLIKGRMSIVLAAIAAVSGADACYELIESAINTAKLGGALSIEVLTSLAEETVLRSKAHQWEVVEAMQGSSSDVLKYLWHCVSSTADPASVAKAFLCLDRWRRAGITLSELQAAYPSFLAALLESLKANNEPMFDAAVTVLADLVREVDVLPARESAIRTVLTGTLAARAHLSSQPNMEEDSKRRHAYGLCSLAAAIGSAEAAFLSKGGSEALALVEWLVDATAGGAGGLGFDGAALALEAWPKLAAVPRSKRVPQFQVPLFEAILQASVRISSFPPDFTTWDASDLERDDFFHFRESSIIDGVAACHKELGTAILGHVSSMLHQGSTWQLKEAGLFVARAVSPAVCTAAMGVGMNGFLGGGNGEDEQAVSAAFVKSLFESLPKGSEGAPLHPLVTAAACQAIEAYAPYAANETNLLEIGVTYAVMALSSQEARGPAAAALRALCTTGIPRLASLHPDALAPLMGACERAAAVTASGGTAELELDERIALAEAMAAVAGALPQPHADEAVRRLAGPSLMSIGQLAHAKAQSSGTSLTLAGDLKVLTAITGACNPLPGKAHPALAMLQDGWTMLGAVAANWANDPAVAAAICGLWAVVARDLGIVLLPVTLEVVNNVVSMYRTHLEPASLDCLAEIIVLHGPSASPELQAALSSTLSDIQASLPVLLSSLDAPEEESNTSPASKNSGLSRRGSEAVSGLVVLPREPLEALRAVCQLARALLRCLPRVLLPQPAFVQLFQCASVCLRRPEAEPALSAAAFLTESISGGPSATGRQPGEPNWGLPQELRTHVNSAVGQLGQQLVEELLTAIASPSQPTALLEPLAEALYALRCQYREATQGAIAAALRSPTFPARPGTLTDSGKQRFVAAVVKEPAHPKRRFSELIMDFSKVCNGQAPMEILQGY